MVLEEKDRQKVCRHKVVKTSHHNLLHQKIVEKCPRIHITVNIVEKNPQGKNIKKNQKNK